jgi:hypothetical protein
MKKVLVLCVAVMAVVLSAKAEVEFAYEAGAELVSAYIWRGQYNGGLSFQPEGLVGFDANDGAIQFRAGAWASVGASDWKFKTDGIEIPDVYNPNTYFVPEVDFIASISAYGASLGYNAYYYCNDGSDHTSELWVGYNFGHFFGEYAGAYVNWYTTVGGGGDLKAETDPAKILAGQTECQAYSSYIELGYDYTFEDLGLTIGAQVGLSPWESPIYGNDKFACTNVSLKIDKEWEFDKCTLNLFASGSINPDGLVTDKSNADYNVFINAAGDDKLYNQKLNGFIGLGIWF